MSPRLGASDARGPSLGGIIDWSGTMWITLVMVVIAPLVVCWSWFMAWGNMMRSSARSLVRVMVGRRGWDDVVIVVAVVIVGDDEGLDVRSFVDVVVGHIL
jgi:hypothetical protein